MTVRHFIAQSLLLSSPFDRLNDLNDFTATFNTESSSFLRGMAQYAWNINSSMQPPPH